ncbi:MAG: type II toxin-antitoxin system VapC family toxin [Bacteroidota bacterium]
MNVLLDTHTFLWFIGGSKHLSIRAREVIEAPSTQRYLSVASLWEAAIKSSLGRLRLGRPVADLVEFDVKGNGIELLGIEPAHLEALRYLPYHHRDPFDRLMIVQSQEEELTLVSRDGVFGTYEVDVVW